MERITPAGVEDYLADLFASPDPVLLEMEALARERSFPIVGSQVGRLLEVLARTSRSRAVLELGSGFGYSAYWFSRGLVEPGHVVLTDGKRENLDQARGFLSRGGFAHRFEFHEGEALELLDRPGEWDIIFCDIDKHAYPKVVAPAVEKLRPGGLLIFDNLLWSGRVLSEAGAGDAATEGVRATNRILASHPKLKSVLVPLRDGVGVAVRA
jgi:predicted O-methyltransferase YrrM